jgi:hypothetical protein
MTGQQRPAGRRRLDVDVIHEDVRQILVALGLGDHARPYSAHEVVQREILPRIHEVMLLGPRSRPTLPPDFVYPSDPR